MVKGAVASAFLLPPERLELPTSGLEDLRSILLNYGGISRILGLGTRSVKRIGV